MCAAGMYPQLPEISSETHIFNLDACHADSLHLREQAREDPWLFFEAKKGSASKKV
jgi:hypothetical protein